MLQKIVNIRMRLLRAEALSVAASNLNWTMDTQKLRGYECAVILYVQRPRQLGHMLGSATIPPCLSWSGLRDIQHMKATGPERCSRRLAGSFAVVRSIGVRCACAAGTIAALSLLRLVSRLTLYRELCTHPLPRTRYDVPTAVPAED